jgi:hypothetical protein
MTWVERVAVVSLGFSWGTTNAIQANLLEGDLARLLLWVATCCMGFAAGCMVANFQYTKRVRVLADDLMKIGDMMQRKG